MKQRLLEIIGGVVVAAAVTVVLLNPSYRGKVHRNSDAQTPDPKLVRANTDFATKPDKAAESYRAYVAEHSKDPDPVVQDQVGTARIRLGYLAARRKDFEGARAVLKTAALEYRGTGTMGADFGGIPDQAAYQAAVCLVAEGKKDQAAHEFRQFLKDRPLSPLVFAARRRLDRLGKADPNSADSLLQADIGQQEAHVRFETSVCGPKCIEYILPLLNKEGHGYKELAKLCGTTDDGTTMDGMRGGLKKLGLLSYGYLVNASDFSHIPTPAIWLQRDHYLVIKQIAGGKATLFDPIGKREYEASLPKVGDGKFSASLLLFSLPQFQTP